MSLSGHTPMPSLRIVDPQRVRRQRLLLVAAWLLTVLAAYVVGRYVMIPQAGTLAADLAQSQAALEVNRRRLAEIEQRLAVVERSEQIARLANENVQGALAAKDDEIAQLRRDLAVYDRLIGPGAQRQPLDLHELVLRPSDDGSVAFSALLTQSNDPRGSTAGRLTLAIEGQRSGRTERLEWPALVPSRSAEGLGFDFRYFQRLEGRITLPGDFQPHTVHVRLAPRGGSAVERTLDWRRVAQQGTS
ncbi:MAG: hypothetical protein KF823_14575 [Xanthomonadales bacterium]|nr:hypothetical protein [Xanthomonadales bacterium]